MGKLITLEDFSASKRSLEKGKVREAIEARDRFLEQYPHMRRYQNDIDRRMRGAGSPENRMAILSMMMRDKLSELREHCEAFILEAERMNSAIQDLTKEKLRIVR